MATEDTDQRGEMLRAFLAEHDEPCPGCGYNLRGLTGAACPECGETLRLRVGMEEPRLGLFVAGLVGLAFGTGFHGLVTVWGFWMVLNGNGGPEPEDFATLLLGVVLCGGGLTLWLRARRRVRHASPAAQAVCLVLCWLIPAGTAGLFMATVS